MAKNFHYKQKLTAASTFAGDSTFGLASMLMTLICYDVIIPLKTVQIKYGRNVRIFFYAQLLTYFKLEKICFNIKYNFNLVLKTKNKFVLRVIFVNKIYLVSNKTVIENMCDNLYAF